MILTEDDYKTIAAKIDRGDNVIDYDKGDETLHIECHFESEGTWEDDYYNGTGAYHELYRQLLIKEAGVCGEDGRMMPVKLDETLLENLVA